MARRLDANNQLVQYNFSHELYQYDRMSRLKSTARDEDGGDRDLFTYNGAGELTGANYGEHWSGEAWISPVRTVTYALDDAGNRAGNNGMSENGIPTSFGTPNNLNQYTAVGGTTVANGSQHELTSLESACYGKVDYAYLGDGPLAGASSTTDGVYTLGYDALGRTVRRTTNGQQTNLIYSGARAILEVDPAQDNLESATIASTLYGLGLDEIIARWNNGMGQWLMQDRLGNTRAVVDQEGKVQEHYRYDAFGPPGS